MFKLKSKLIIAVMVMFGITAFMSCEKEDENKNLNSIELIPSQFEYVGVEHNKGLEYIYNELKKDISSTKTKDELFFNVEKHCNEFYAHSEVIKDYLQESKNISSQQLKTVRANYENHKSHNSYLDSTIANSNLSEVTKSLLVELMAGIDAAVILDDINLITNEINNKAINLISDSTELIILFTTTNVLSYSCLYWSENLEEWEALFGNSNKSIAKFSWGELGKADAVGAVGGGVTGLICGAIFGPGALVVGGVGALAGGVGASAGDAVSQLWPW